MNVMSMVGVAAGHGTALAIDPARIATDVMFFFPDGQTVFDLIDDVTAGTKCLVAVWRADAHPHGNVADCQIADAMHAARELDTKPGAGLVDDALAFFDAKRLKGFVFEMCNTLAFVVIAHPAFKGRVTAVSRIAQFALQLRDIQRRIAESKCAHLLGCRNLAAGNRRDEDHGIAIGQDA